MGMLQEVWLYWRCCRKCGFMRLLQEVGHSSEVGCLWQVEFHGECNECADAGAG